ncbi:hypothetical protein [Streptomyces sp. NBC_00454]|uniref:hypothetical protein n=1 Tax=Streptomyces sp. NBC_00454 TaxID=2975747 RepID=UPI0030E0DFDA
MAAFRLTGGRRVADAGAHDDLTARMRAWAGEHRAARESALAAARERLTAQGCAVREGG